MHYTKDKNIISIFIDDEKNRKYTIDINTGIIIGLRGKAVKTIANPYRCEFTDTYTKLDSFVMRYVRRQLYWNEPIIAKTLAFYDKIDSLNDEVVNQVLNRWNTIDDTLIDYDFKKVVDYIRKNPQCYASDIVFAFQQEKQKTYFGDISLTDNDISTLLYRMHTDVRNKDVTMIPLVYWHMYSYYLNNQHMKDMLYGRDMVIEYLMNCEKLGVEPRKNNNVIREFYETKKRYEMLKEEISAKAFSKQYAQHPKAWEFEYGDFIVRIPTTGKDLVTEGAKMHHCVGGYVDNVAEGQCYICFIRHKDTPDEPYITCQVYPTGVIGQYYLAHDRRIAKDEDKVFKQAFQNYLDRVW